MTPLPNIRVHFTLQNLNFTATTQPLVGGFYQEGPTAAPVPSMAGYLWTAFFKIDADSNITVQNGQLQGTATVVSTPGDQPGDLSGNAQVQANGYQLAVPVAASLGDYRTLLKPFSVLGQLQPAAMGALAILWMKGATPVSALAQGYQALISSLQTQLNGIISSLNANTTEASLQALLPGVQNQIVSAVKSAIKNGMDLLAKLAAAAGATEDNPVAQLVWLFTTSDLDATQPGAVVANDGLLALGNGYPQNPASQFGFDAEPGVTSSYNVTANFQGTLTADPQPVHLRPILQRLGVTSTGQAMAQLPASVQPPGSVTAWIDATT